MICVYAFRSMLTKWILFWRRFSCKLLLFCLPTGDKCVNVPLPHFSFNIDWFCVRLIHKFTQILFVSVALLCQKISSLRKCKCLLCRHFALYTHINANKKYYAISVLQWTLAVHWNLLYLYSRLGNFAVEYVFAFIHKPVIFRLAWFVVALNSLWNLRALRFCRLFICMLPLLIGEIY